MHPTPFNPKASRGTLRMTARLALGDLYLMTDWEQRKNGAVSFLGHGVYGWDPRGRCYTLHWFDNVGIEHGAPFFGSWEGDSLTLLHEMTQFGTSRHVYTLTGDELRLRLEMSPDGKEWNTFLEGTYRRTATP